MSNLENTSRLCLMCGGGDSPLTGEHVFPQWLKEFAPIDQKRRPVNRFYPNSFNRDAGTKQVRQICRNCNSGWMSRLQNAAKTPITRLHENPSFLERSSIFSLSHEEIIVLTKWAIMTTMVIELLDVLSNSVSATQRAAFAADQSYDASWKVWFAQSCTEPDRGFTHKKQIIPITKGTINAPQILLGRPTEWQTTTFVAGRAIFVTSSGITIPKFIDNIMINNGFIELTHAITNKSTGRCVVPDVDLLNLNERLMRNVASYYNNGQNPLVLSHVSHGPVTPVR